MKKLLTKKSTYLFLAIVIVALLLLLNITNTKKHTYEISTITKEDFVITSIDLGEIIDTGDGNTDIDEAYELYEKSKDEISQDNDNTITKNKFEKVSDDLYKFNPDESDFSVKMDGMYNYQVYFEDNLIDEFKLSFLVSDPVKNIVNVKSTQTSPSEYLYIEYEMYDPDEEDNEDKYYTSIKHYWDTHKSDFRLDKDVLHKESFGLYEINNGIVFFEKHGNSKYLYNYGFKKIELDDKKIIYNQCCEYGNMNVNQYEDKVIYYSIKTDNHLYKNTIEFPKDSDGKVKKINSPNRVQEILETLINSEEVWNKEGDIYEFGIGWVGGINIIDEQDAIFNEVNFRNEYTLKNGWIIKTWEDKEYKSYKGNHLVTVHTSDEIIKIGLNRDEKDKFLCLIRTDLLPTELTQKCISN